jgi:hypothetical protein
MSMGAHNQGLKPNLTQETSLIGVSHHIIFAPSPSISMWVITLDMQNFGYKDGFSEGKKGHKYNAWSCFNDRL